MDLTVQNVLPESQYVRRFPGDPNVYVDFFEVVIGDHLSPEIFLWTINGLWNSSFF